MQIAVLSGKGGTGKTFLAVHLAAAAGKSNYVDCDVEEPNGHLFLKPAVTNRENVEVTFPEFENSLCSGCRICVKFCRFNALIFVQGKPKVFPELCHSCGGCSLICPNKVIHERKRTVGKIETGMSGDITVMTGTMNSGEASAVPIIRHLLRKIPKLGTTIIDCPPGSSCTVMESIRDADYCLLVAEPTLFGLENLKSVVQLADTFQKPCGIVINKDIGTGNLLERFSENSRIPILARIPYDAALARRNARGELAMNWKNYSSMFQGLLKQILSSEEKV